LYLDVEPGGRIRAAACEATGCAISVASASMLTEMVRGRDATGARALIADVDAMLAGRGEATHLGVLASLSGVRAYPSRVRCATLPWRALEAALAGADGPITTEGET
jgi:nitrogen fixation NifU-like protein